MSSGYINVPIVSDPEILIQQSFINLATNIQGWIPREGNLEVALIEEMARVAASTASVASDVPKSIFRYFGSLIKIPPLDGIKAEILTTWNLFGIPDSPYSIAPGTVAGFIWQGIVYQFETVETVTFDGVNQQTNVKMRAVEAGAAYNIANALGLDPVGRFLDLLDVSNTNVQTVAITATSSTNTNLAPGTDPETDEAYLTRLARELQLLTPRPITTGDFAEIAKNSPNVYRAVAIDGFDPFTNLVALNDADLTTGAAVSSFWTPVSNSSSSTETTSVSGTGMSGTSTTITVAANGTNNFASSGTITVVASGGNLVFSYTGKTSNTFTGCTRTSGTSTWTIANNAVVTGSAIVATNPNGLSVMMKSMSESSLTNDITTSSANIVVDSAITGASIAQSVPVVVRDESGNGSEILLINSVGGTGNKTLGLEVAPTLAHVHTTSALKVATLQGVVSSELTAENGSLYPNTSWLQAAAVVKCGSDTTAKAMPIVAVLATYANGSKKIYSSLTKWSNYKIVSSAAAPNSYDYTGNTATIVANVPCYTSDSPTLAPYAASPFNTIQSPIQSVKMYVLWDNATATKDHYLMFSSINLCDFDFGSTGTDDTNSVSSTYNFVPDSDFLGYTANSLSGWTVPSGYNVLPGFGLQYPGSGSALASDLVATSSIFTLPPIQGATGETSRAYTFFANVKVTGYTAHLDYIDIELVDAANTTITTLSSPTDIGSGTYVAHFNTSDFTHNNDMYVRVKMAAGINIPSNASVVISKIGVLSGTLDAGDVNSKYNVGYSWTKGGNFVLNTFVAPRTVTVAPVSVTGLPISRTEEQNLATNLSSYREVNFDAEVVQPNYIPIDISWAAVSSPGYDTTTVQNNVDTAIKNFINPAHWGGGQLSPTRWDGTQVVLRILDVAAVIGNVAGIANVTSLQIGIPTSGSSNLSSSNISLAGIAPLPVANKVVGVVTPSTIDSPLKSV